MPPSCLYALWRHAQCAALALCAVLNLSCPTQAQVTLLVPSRANIDAPTIEPAAESPRIEPPKAVPTGPASQSRGKVVRDKAAQDKEEKMPAALEGAGVRNSDEGGAASHMPQTNRATAIDEEVDLLITMMHPFTQDCLAMDMPELFTVLRYDNATPLGNGVLQGERRDLLGDVEEIRYLDKKAWGANVALQKPGLYQFSIDSRPWWDAPRGRFIQHYVKTMLPVYGVERGWDTPIGQRFEIQPLIRPFGLTAPALFSGRVLLNGEPLRGAAVRLARINTDKGAVPTRWHEELASSTDMAGQFAFVVNQPGWWCCMAQTAADPLKGPDGTARPLELGALFWFYVDSAAENRKR
ncbi:MAG: DUF4198 domain-containing protein [Desulfovibrio sp.]|jgi:hypothetical protein|nr:DUF4198 domain-containing protein [Desulfovibrio sp.]